MSVMIEDLRSRFGQLQRREQMALLLMSAFLLVVFFYLAVWAPADSFVADSRLDYSRHQKLLQYLRSTETEAKASKGGPARSMGGRSMLTKVSRTTQGAGISPSRMQPEGSDAVSVWFESVGFSQLMIWLERLESGQGIVVRQISIDSRGQPGQVSARIVLRS